MRNRSLSMILAVIFYLFFLTACGGGGGGGTSETPKNPNIYLAQSTIDFGGIVMDNNEDRSFYIKNTGNANLNIGQISSPALPFSISSETCSNKTLTPNQTCSLIARFSPTVQGPITGALTIPSNDPDSSAVNVTLSGEGYGLNVWINQINSAGCPSIMSVDVTVTDARNIGPLGPLTAGDFILKQNGQQQAITVSPLELSPVSVVLALDMSISLTAAIDEIKTAGKYFVDQLGDTDEAAICKFKNEVEIYPVPPDYFIQTTTTGKNALKAYIETAFYAVSGTAFYDAVFQSIDRAALGLGTTGKPAVIVLSDGVNNKLYTVSKTI